MEFLINALGAEEKQRNLGQSICLTVARSLSVTLTPVITVTSCSSGLDIEKVHKYLSPAFFSVFLQVNDAGVAVYCRKYPELRFPPPLRYFNQAHVDHR